jgi:Flp pilus assembly protein TadB
MNQPNRAALWAALRLVSILAALAAGVVARLLGGNSLVIIGSAVLVYALFWAVRAYWSRRPDLPRG